MDPCEMARHPITVKMNKKLIFIAVFFLAGCHKVPLQISIPQNPLYTILAEMKGKKLYDKRESIAERESDRELERAVKKRV